VNSALQKLIQMERNAAAFNEMEWSELMTAVNGCLKVLQVCSTAVKHAPVKDSPVKAKPVKDAPVKAKPVKDTVKAALVIVTPVIVTPVIVTPVKDTCGQSAPIWLCDAQLQSQYKGIRPQIEGPVGGRRL